MWGIPGEDIIISANIIAILDQLLKKDAVRNESQYLVVKLVMKRISLLLISTALFCSCEKDNVSNQRFKGIWEYENHFGYPFANGYLPPGNGRIIVLSADGSFERKQHDTVMFRGRYHLDLQKDCYGDEKKIHFSTNDNGYSWDSYINIDSGKLKLSTPNCYQDGGTTVYRKIGG